MQYTKLKTFPAIWASYNNIKTALSDPDGLALDKFKEEYPSFARDVTRLEKALEGADAVEVKDAMLSVQRFVCLHVACTIR